MFLENRLGESSRLVKLGGGKPTLIPQWECMAACEYCISGEKNIRKKQKKYSRPRLTGIYT